jgi:hypothetical protein
MSSSGFFLKKKPPSRLLTRARLLWFCYKAGDLSAGFMQGLTPFFHPSDKDQSLGTAGSLCIEFFRSL